MTQKLIDKTKVTEQKVMEEKVGTKKVEKVKSTEKIKITMVNQDGTSTIEIVKGTTPNELAALYKLSDEYTIRRQNGTDLDSPINEGEMVLFIPKIKGGK